CGRSEAHPKRQTRPLPEPLTVFSVPLLPDTRLLHDDSSAGRALDTVFYTPAVVNSPGRIEDEISRFRSKLRDLARRPVRLEGAAKLESIRRRDREHAQWAAHDYDWFAGPTAAGLPNKSG